MQSRQLSDEETGSIGKNNQKINSGIRFYSIGNNYFQRNNVCGTISSYLRRINLIK